MIIIYNNNKGTGLPQGSPKLKNTNRCGQLLEIWNPVSGPTCIPSVSETGFLIFERSGIPSWAASRCFLSSDTGFLALGPTGAQTQLLLGAFTGFLEISDLGLAAGQRTLQKFVAGRRAVFVSISALILSKFLHFLTVSFNLLIF